MVSIDSCLAESMNAHVFTTSTSASAASAVTSWPACCDEPEHHLGVDEVLGAAEGDEANLHRMAAGMQARVVAMVRFATSPQSEPRAYGYSRYSIRGYGIVSRTCSRPQIQATTRSMPMPKPPCGTEP